MCHYDEMHENINLIKSALFEIKLTINLVTTVLNAPIRCRLKFSINDAQIESIHYLRNFASVVASIDLPMHICTEKQSEIQGNCFLYW